MFNKIWYNTNIRIQFFDQTRRNSAMQYRQIKYLRWVKCSRCRLFIAVQTGDSIPLGLTATCPRCGQKKQVTAGSFITPEKLPLEVKMQTMESIGLTLPEE